MVQAARPRLRWVRGGLGQLHRSDPVEKVARGGLAARAGFYLVLAYIAVRIAVLHGGAGQANAHGALALIAESILGKIAIGVAAFGFLSFGLVRIGVAIRDDEPSAWSRGLTAAQGVLYLGLAYVPVSYLLGDHQTGSEHQQKRHTAQLLGFTGGRELVVAIGVGVIVMCGWQIRSTITGDYLDGMKLSGTSPAVRRAVHFIGAAGIVARALIYLPLGIFLIVAAVQYDPKHSDGLDGEMLAVSRHTGGDVLIVIAAAGLVVFAAWSILEARYRDVHAQN